MTGPKFSSRQRYIASPLAEGLIVALPQDDRVFLLNGTARFMWERRAEGVPESEIPALIAAHYGIDIARAKKDFLSTFRRWRAEGLVRANCAQHPYEIAGLAFDIRYHDADLSNVIVPILAHLTRSSDKSRQGRPLLEFDIESRKGKIILSKNGIQVLRTSDLDKIIETLTSDLFRYVSEKADWRVSLHAAAVGTAGSCVLMPGASGSGKSSLTAALLSLDGVQYLTDDLALLAPASLAVIPVPMPLVLKNGSWDALDSFLPDLAAKVTYRRFGKASRYWAPPRARIARKAMPVKAIVFPHYVEGADTNLTPLGPFEAMGCITAAPSAVRPPITHRVIAELASFAQQVPAYTLTYGALAEARSMVQSLLWP
jgi:hypothetical protein